MSRPRGPRLVPVLLSGGLVSPKEPVLAPSAAAVVSPSHGGFHWAFGSSAATVSIPAPLGARVISCGRLCDYQRCHP